MNHRLRTTMMLVATVATGLGHAAEKRDPAAVAVAQHTLEAMGGAKSFEALRTLRFDFVVEREGKEMARIRHVWDRWDGRYRVEGRNKEGKPTLTLFNVQKRGEGRAWVDGKELAGEELKAALERGYGRFINDTYWLLMPAKMLDPGVSLASEGTTTVDGKTYDVVKLTFDGVGMTPQDTYWAYVSKDTGLMERWDMVLTGQDAKDRSTFMWEDWRPIGAVRLSMAKRAVADGTVIRFDNVSGSTDADASSFAAP
jgi:hypothetical protein